MLKVSQILSDNIWVRNRVSLLFSKICIFKKLKINPKIMEIDYITFNQVKGTKEVIIIL